MTSQTSTNTGWRRAARGRRDQRRPGRRAAWPVWARPTPSPRPAADPTTGTDAPPPMTADQALAIIATEYDTGAGGGQISTLIHQVLKLRARGLLPVERATGTTSWPRWTSGRTRRR